MRLCLQAGGGGGGGGGMPSSQIIGLVQSDGNAADSKD